MFNNDYYIISILYDKKVKFNFIGLHNDVVDRDKNLNEKDYALSFDGVTDRETILNILRNGLYDLTISLDYRFINDIEIISILKEKKIKVIRIIGDNYSLSASDYEKLSFAKQILVDSVDSNVKYPKDRISLQNNIFRKEYKKGTSNQITYFVNRSLAPLEISLLVSNLKRSMNTYGSLAHYLLSFRTYSKENYYNILLELKKYNLPSSVKIQFLGNPLEDLEEDYSKLCNIIDNDIEIIYNSSNNVLNKYLNEPYTRYNYHHLEIEVEGICSLNEYVGLLNEVNTISNYIDCRGYSPLESLIYDYRYLHKHYMKKKEEESIFTRRKQLSSDEFTNLLSLLMRKNNIKVYKYSTDDHVRNIVLILDFKYKVFKIGILDPSWDAVYQDNKGENFNTDSHTFFMISPKDTLRFYDPECITLGSTLVLDEQIIKKIGDSSRSIFESSINDDYSSMVNAVYLLTKFGYEINSKRKYFEILEKLDSKGYFDTLDTDIIKSAIKVVEERENFGINSYDIAKKIHLYQRSLLKRNHAFVDLDTIKMLDDNGNPALIELKDEHKIYKK